MQFFYFILQQQRFSVAAGPASKQQEWDKIYFQKHPSVLLSPTEESEELYHL